MSAENEIVRLALGGIHSLASILRNYDLPKDLQQIIDFTDSNFSRLENSKTLNQKIEPKVSLSKENLAKQIVVTLWHVLSIGRIYNAVYLKNKKRKDFIHEAIAYDKEVSNDNQANS